MLTVRVRREATVWHQQLQLMTAGYWFSPRQSNGKVRFHQLQKNTPNPTENEPIAISEKTRILQGTVAPKNDVEVFSGHLLLLNLDLY